MNVIEFLLLIFFYDIRDGDYIILLKDYKVGILVFVVLNLL